LPQPDYRRAGGAAERLLRQMPTAPPMAEQSGGTVSPCAIRSCGLLRQSARGLRVRRELAGLGCAIQQPGASRNGLHCACAHTALQRIPHLGGECVAPGRKALRVAPGEGVAEPRIGTSPIIRRELWGKCHRRRKLLSDKDLRLNISSRQGTSPIIHGCAETPPPATTTRLAS